MAKARSRLWTVVILLLMAAAIVVAGARLGVIPEAYNPLAPIDLRDPPNAITTAKLWIMQGHFPACVSALRRAGVAVRPMPFQSERPGCSREGTVLISKLSRAGLAPEEMKCDVALRLYLLERHGIQPLARRQLGSEVDRISHFGSYACRNKRGGSSLSEHASANAFDISGFKLPTGRMVTLKKDWTSGGPSARFLRDVRVKACRLFNMVLSPDYNADHADHFHVDMGWIIGCH